MSFSVKICGLTTREAITACLDNGADFIGLVFCEQSPRNLTLAQARALVQFVAERAKTVAVTVDPTDRLLDAIVEFVKPDYLQLHGNETPERVTLIQQRYQLPIIKAITVNEREDFRKALGYKGTKILFDAKPTVKTLRPGGNGVAFDWSLLKTLDAPIDYMLSGGLNASNIKGALEITRATAVDVSSGVESSPGVKDLTMIADFFAAIKNFIEQGSQNA